MGLVLDISPRTLEKVLYFANFIVTDPGNTDFAYKEILTETQYREAVWAETGYSFEQGLLTYEEMKQAFVQLMEAGDLTHDEEINVRMMLHHAHNDNFRSEQTTEFTDDDLTLFRENALWLICI
jgi:DNA-directed RNA polymerase beta' subunit